jgi:hypothetical protein
MDIDEAIKIANNIQLYNLDDKQAMHVLLKTARIVKHLKENNNENIKTVDDVLKYIEYSLNTVY